MSYYQIAILGLPADVEREALKSTLAAMVGPFGLTIGKELVLLSAAACATRDPKCSFAAAYFGGKPDAPSINAIGPLVRENLPIIPVVSDSRHFSGEIPQALHAFNAITISKAGPRLEGLASALLECVGLLRPQRRVFLSYKRTESARAALQLHETLGSFGFDVFLDTFDVRPGADFQAVLWHRLCDSDVLVMLDTPGYFNSRWTAAEIGRALAKKIAVLGVVWPGHEPERVSQLRQQIFLEDRDLTGKDGPLTDEAAETIRIAVERLRSRSLAIRHAAIAGAIRSATEQIGGHVNAIGLHRGLTLTLPDGRKVHAFPSIGVPTAENFNEIADNCESLGGEAGREPPIIVYDHIGLHTRWQKHLDWLRRNIGSVKSLEIAQAAWQLADWGH